MKKSILVFLMSVVLTGSILAFCGFYVAKIEAKIFNKTSKVILVRSDGQTVVTMESDFNGDLKDFAMVVPVPEVLKRSQIRVVNPAIFQKIDAYSGPRLVEYHDTNPCMPVTQAESLGDMEMSESVTVSRDKVHRSARKNKVKIEAKYTVGGYDILILSAKNSDGLENWLTENGYKIPKGASDVLKPYIKNNMKFFVVKVNLEAFGRLNVDKLQPIQMTFRSDKFMLPIRLGMANADGDQDMIVYSLTDQGRVELSNYRTVEMPSNMNIPTFVRDDFGKFYASAFEQKWKKEGKSVGILEYAWDISGNVGVKCDPCPSPALPYADLREAGVFWLKDMSRGNYNGKLHFTRLHIRYNRESFPQDLLFNVTPNKARYQARYVMNNPAQGDLSCDPGQKYLLQIIDRREKELKNLYQLTGWASAEGAVGYISRYQDMIKKEPNAWIERLPKKEKNKRDFVLPFSGEWKWPIGLVLILGFSIFIFINYPNKNIIKLA